MKQKAGFERTCYCACSVTLQTQRLQRLESKRNKSSCSATKRSSPNAVGPTFTFAFGKQKATPKFLKVAFSFQKAVANAPKFDHLTLTFENSELRVHFCNRWSSSEIRSLVAESFFFFPFCGRICFLFPLLFSYQIEEKKTKSRRSGS